jgi:uncharacterized protein (TIGR03083 family)
LCAQTSRLRPVEPVDTVGLFRPLHRKLIELLRGLDASAWERPTAAGTWTVRQVAAHLLHGDMRKLSASPGPDDALGDPVPFDDLVEIIEVDNARGVELLAQLSPSLLIDLLDVTGRGVAGLFAGLPPEGRAATNVAWADEAVSANWTDVGREFTERWHHQMHIRDAVGAPGLKSRRWIEPILRLSVLALRRSYARVAAEPGTTVVLRVSGSWRHEWSMVRGPHGWDLLDGAGARPDAAVSMDAQSAWRSFFDFCSVAETRARTDVQGDVALAEPILRARSVMIREAISGA